MSPPSKELLFPPAPAVPVPAQAKLPVARNVSWPQLSLVRDATTVAARAHVEPKSLLSSDVPGADSANGPGGVHSIPTVQQALPGSQTAADPQSSVAASVALLDAIDEVMSHRDPDTICRLAVTLARERLGLERTALLLVDETGNYLCGTWGTSGEGNTSDEHEVYVQFETRHHEAARQAKSGSARWSVFSEVSLFSQDGGKTRAVARGWNAMTPIFGRDRLIGFLVNDTAATGRPLNEEAQTRVVVFCRMLGGMLDDIERGSRGLPWESVLARRPFVPHDSHRRLAHRAMRVLHGDPTASNQVVADECKVSTSHLNTVFRKTLGLSLREYRNRLRVERFFTEVAPEGGNLMQAALKAGFGSYAQFHRVFREMLGSTPREHLSARARTAARVASAAAAVPEAGSNAQATTDAEAEVA